MKPFFSWLFVFVCFSVTAAETENSRKNSDDGIRWILEEYQVAEPVSLIPEKGLNGWTAHYGKPLKKSKWVNKDGKLILEFTEKNYDHEGGDLVSAEQYADFILDFAWIAGKGSNSGVKFRLKDFGEIGAKINYSKTFGWLGMEYQILDDFNHPESKKGEGEKSAASLYSIFAPDKEKKHLRPHGQVNEGRIVVLRHHIEHWLNGEKVLQYDVGSKEWKKALENSKFARAKGFGENSSGFIILQDHGNPITFEKVVIRKIGEKKQ